SLGTPSCRHCLDRVRPSSRHLSIQKSSLQEQEPKRRRRCCRVKCTSCSPYFPLGLETLLKRETQMRSQPNRQAPTRTGSCWLSSIEFRVRILYESVGSQTEL